MVKMPSEARGKGRNLTAQPRTRSKVQGTRKGTPGAPPAFTVEQVATALAKAGGVPFRAAKLLKCDRKTVMRYIDKYPELEDVQLEAKEEWLDESEDQLRNAIRRGEGWAVKFHLMTQGKDRGYVDRKEVTGANGAPIGRQSSQVVVIQVPDNRRDQIHVEARPVIDVPHQVIEDKRDAEG